MVTRPKLRLSRYLVPVIIVLAIIFSIRQCGNQEKPSGHPRDYAAIAKEGILRVATEYNSISFYVDGDTDLKVRFFIMISSPDMLPQFRYIFVC